MGGHRRAYLAQAEVCRGCEAVESRQSRFGDGEKIRGLRIVLRRNMKALGIGG